MIGLRRIAISALRCYLLLAVFLTPFQFHVLSGYTELLRAFLTPILLKISSLLGLNPVLLDISSDTILFIVLQLTLILIGIGFAVVLKLTTKNSFPIPEGLFRSIIAYYLSLMLLRYGLDKLFLLQFPEPEPNLLFTPFGNLDRDILYWSVMGIGKGYSVFIGIVEILSGILLLFKRTRELGAFMAFMILLNVVAINFGFDISVKVFSSMLTIMALYLCFPVLRLLFRYFFRPKTEGQEALETSDNTTNSTYVKWLKFITLVIIFLEVGSPYVSLYDEKKQATMETLAFEVSSAEGPSHTTLPKRIFLHSDNYLILQMENLETISYPTYNYDPDENKWLIKIDGQFTQVQITTNTLGFEHLNCKSLSEVPIALKRVDHTKMPALQNNFHFTVDQLITK